MKTEPIRMLAALPIALGLAMGSCLAEAEDANGSKSPLQPVEVAADRKGQVQTPPSPTGEQPPPADAAAPAEGAAESGTQPAAGTEGTAETAAEDQGEPEASEQEPEAVTGAFGIPLGERFEPCLVAKVLGEEEKTYRTPDKTERKGTLYRVEPKVPNTHFNAYSVETTGDGVVYAIRADHEPAVKESKCDVTKEIAATLEEKYGKPRGRSPFGHWYAFRDMSVKHYRGIRLYANRCRRGIYQVVYGDDGVKGASPPAVPEPSATSGL